MNATELRELDAWIAEYVFGAKNIEWIDCWAELGCPKKPFSNHGADSIPEYTTDPAAAMMVLEKCSGRLLGYITIGKFERFQVMAKKHIAESETLPQAICLFAKKLFEK